MKTDYLKGLRQCAIHDVSTRLFNIEYYNEKGTILKETQIRGRNMDEAQVHFKFFYPKKYIWKITAL